MGKNNRSTCKHYLRLVWRQGKPSNTLWAQCQYCPRSWFIGRNSHKIAEAGAR